MSARGGKKKGAKKDDWQCNWCQTSKPSWKARGPRGPKTLCETCNGRWRRGETGPRSDDWSCDWCGVEDSPRRFKGPKGPGTLCEQCGISHAKGARAVMRRSIIKIARRSRVPARRSRRGDSWGFVWSLRALSPCRDDLYGYVMAQDGKKPPSKNPWLTQATSPNDTETPLRPVKHSPDGF